MKNSAQYEKKVKRLIAKRVKASPSERTDRIALLVEGVLGEDTTPAKVSLAMSVLEEEFVDFNELRVSPLRDIVEVLGADFPDVRAKAEVMTTALQAIFDRTNTLSLDFLAKMTKREVRSLLREKVGLSPYAESVVTLFGFGGHAMPVDNLLTEALKLDGLIHPDSDMPDLQGFLERITPGKDAMSWHEGASRLCRRSRSQSRQGKGSSQKARRSQSKG